MCTKSTKSYGIHNIPHQGSLCRVVEGNNVASYVIEIRIDDTNKSDHVKESRNGSSYHELVFNRNDFEFAARVFAILDSESTSFVRKETVHEFVTLRCPVFLRRDEDLIRLSLDYTSSQSQYRLNGQQRMRCLTFDEIWESVVSCCRNHKEYKDKNGTFAEILGLEGWMVFFRFIALAQYHEGKRRFSARHLQQTMRHRNSPRGSELVVVDVPPPEPPVNLTPFHLAKYEQNNKAALPAPELDLDHSLLAAHDFHVANSLCCSYQSHSGTVKVSLFGSPSSFPSSNPSNSNGLEFALTYCYGKNDATSQGSEFVVRRSMADMKWLDETFSSQKVLGGTLCGRILPPFPGISTVSSKTISSHFHHISSDESTTSIFPTSLSISKTTGTAINAAATGVGRITDIAKSFMSGYLGSKLTTNKPEEASGGSLTSSAKSPQSRINQTGSQRHLITKKKKSLSLPESYYNPNSPAGKARQLERYLNYLLEHPALSTSFPLNTMLKASQSGVEAAKQCLEECSRVTKEIQDRTPQLVDGKVGIPFWPQGSSFSPNSPSFAWVRTAAQAAIALKVHGMLETTGLPSASARLQHASLPSFGNFSSRGTSGWEDLDFEGGFTRATNTSTVGHTSVHGSNFEEGVINDDGFDLLPLPVPAPERRILSAGSTTNADFVTGAQQREERFHYGAPRSQRRFTLEEDDDHGVAYLGDVSVDENIDKLREVIGSVDNTLSRCLASMGAIGKGQREKQSLHISVVGGLDSWLGMRGKFVCQRPLLKGLEGLEQSKEISEEGNLAMIDDLSWQTSLASHAVSAAEDVRAAVRAFRTASNARATACSAALSAQLACEKAEFATLEDARAAQTRSSIAQSHAIHAAVVEHEAKTIKRRATLALAHDVKTWNVHRKREMLRSCIAYAKAQHQSTRRAVDSWSSLRDGFIDAAMAPATVDRRHFVPHAPIPAERRRPQIDPDEVTATIFEHSIAIAQQPAIMAVDHNILSSLRNQGLTETSSISIEVQEPETFLPIAEKVNYLDDNGLQENCLNQIPSTNIPFCMQDPHPRGHEAFSTCSSESEPPIPSIANSGLSPENPIVTRSPELYFEQEQSNCFVTTEASLLTMNDSKESFGKSAEAGNGVDDDAVGDLVEFRRICNKQDANIGHHNNEDKLSESMQSLVDGLMSWGGGFDAEEEHFALPTGMATAIALESSGAVGTSSLI